MYIYLDLDGVLVRKGNPLSSHYSGLEFTQTSLSYLEDVVMNYKDINIIISSDWRLYKSIHMIKDTSFKHTKLYDFIIDKTLDNLESRESEIEAHVTTNKIPWDKVIILDDLNLKGICSKYLIKTNIDIGLSNLEYNQLKNIIERSVNVV